MRSPYRAVDPGYNNLKPLIMNRLEELGMSVEMLALRMRQNGTHVTRTSIYNWANDKRRPHPTLAVALADALMLPHATVLNAYSLRPRTPLDKEVGVRHTTIKVKAASA